MKVLLLEDESLKKQQIVNVIHSIDASIEIKHCSILQDFIKEFTKNKYHLIIVDILVPKFNENHEAEDVSISIFDLVSDPSSTNFLTNTIAITQYDELLVEHSKVLNQKNVTIVNYDDINDSPWKETLKIKIESSIPKVTFDFVILCALEKEARGYQDAGYDVGPVKEMDGFRCKTINIKEKKGLIVIQPRMGLVTCSIIASRIIERFSPKLICMSGICAGIEKKAAIYEVIIPQSCLQHDAGKWGSHGYESEPYSVQITNALFNRISEIIAEEDFSKIIDDIRPRRSELPPSLESLKLEVQLAPCSSGSSVIANTDMVKVIEEQHRKSTAFEMESYALYEAARLAQKPPLYFSAKSVVDDGTESKSSDYHRIACIISAKVVYELIKRGVMD